MADSLSDDVSVPPYRGTAIAKAPAVPSAAAFEAEQAIISEAVSKLMQQDDSAPTNPAPSAMRALPSARTVGVSSAKSGRLSPAYTADLMTAKANVAKLFNEKLPTQRPVVKNAAVVQATGQVKQEAPKALSAAAPADFSPPPPQPQLQVEKEVIPADGSSGIRQLSKSEQPPLLSSAVAPNLTEAKEAAEAGNRVSKAPVSIPPPVPEGSKDSSRDMPPLEQRLAAEEAKHSAKLVDVPSPKASLSLEDFLPQEKPESVDRPEMEKVWALRLQTLEQENQALRQKMNINESDRLSDIKVDAVSQIHEDVLRLRIDELENTLNKLSMKRGEILPQKTGADRKAPANTLKNPAPSTAP